VNIIGLRSVIPNNPNFKFAVIHNIFAKELPAEEASSYKQPLIQQILHAAFDPLRVRQHFPCDSNF
jgi:hypothetical protein